MTIDLSQSLKHHFGFDRFRQGQEQTIHQLLNGHSSLSIFPTGSGKSLCYQLSALHLPHLTLVVSPLLALMKDQLQFLASKGICAASIDSTLKADQSKEIMSDVRSGKIKILMVSVERFKNERFRQFIRSVNVSMLVIDEAHCISEWGHNFRPDYLKLPSYRKDLNIPLVLLLTATATNKVKQDMADKFAISSSHIVQTGFYRKNLDLSVIAVTSLQRNEMLLAIVNEQMQLKRNQQGTCAGIVYVTLQHTAEQVADFLISTGLNVSAYHAGFDSDKRAQIQTDFMSSKIDVIVATIAFGMGIDKADIRFVIHYDLPKSIENYSQEIGRAGRDGLPSNCITLANLDGLNTVENFVYGDTPELNGIGFVLDNIKAETQNNQWELQLLPLSNVSNIRELPMKTLLVQLEILGVIKPLYAYFADFNIKLLTSKDNILAKFNAERSQFLATIFSHTQFKRVWGSLNFDSLLREINVSGENNRNRVITALDYLHEQGLIELETKKMTEVFNVNLAKLAEVDLAETLYDYFIDKEQKEIKRIASLVHFFELDGCLSHHLSHYFDDKNVPDNCGHCSVCRGQQVTLNYSTIPQWPKDEQLIAVLMQLTEHLAGKLAQPLTLDSYCRFLSGISVPIFSRNKVRQLAGFGLCQQLRYDEIRKKISLLLSKR